LVKLILQGKNVMKEIIVEAVTKCPVVTLGQNFENGGIQFPLTDLLPCEPCEVETEVEVKCAFTVSSFGLSVSLRCEMLCHLRFS
jgi:hypothetical protein